MGFGFAKPVFLAALFSFFAAPSLAANGIFAGGPGQITQWAPSDSLVFRALPNNVNISFKGAALDSHGVGKLYWANQAQISRSNVDGSDLQVVLPFTRQVGEIAIGTQNNLIYWTDRPDCDGHGDDGVFRANADGSGVMTLNNGTQCPLSVTIDNQGGKIYWGAAVDGIYRSGLDGSQLQLLVSYSGQYVNPLSIRVHPAAGKMYWASNTWFGPGYSGIHRANLDGTEIEDLFEGFVLSLSLDLEDGKLYWTQETQGSRQLRRSNFDGSEVEDITPNSLSGFEYVVVDSRQPYCTRTAMYGDITNLPGSVEFGDISAIVDAFRGHPSIDSTLCDLYPCDLGGNRCMGDGVIDFRDISQAVSAFRGMFTCPQ